MNQGGIGATCPIPETPYAFENVVDDPLTVTYHWLTDTYEINGTARLLPTSRIYTNEEVTIPLEEGNIARDIDSSGAPDWGHLSQIDIRQANMELTFCRAIAQFEAGLPVTEWETIVEGEPARRACVDSGSRWIWTRGMGLRLVAVGDGEPEIHELRPSGRIKVKGCVKVLETGQICKNGWIDKDGHVISTER